MKTLPSPIASHTDMLLFALKDRIFVSEKYLSEAGISFPDLKNKITVIKETQGDCYPSDALLNGLVIGNRLFCKRESFSNEAREYAKECGLEIIFVRQGYPACTVLKVSDSAAITADPGMKRALEKEGISVLNIENGSILLFPYEYGFIGGAAGVFGDTVYFLGNLSSHPQYENIIRFITDNKMKVISLSDEPLADLGGILFIEEGV
jgi:hypothetical protein